MADGKTKRFKAPDHWSIAQRLAHHSEEGLGGCRVWTASRNFWGYGKIGWRGKIYKAHRLAWEETNGPIPLGLFVCHHCDNPPCINPDHLFLGTNDDNTADKVSKGRQARGAEAGNVFLTERQVLAIRTDTRSHRMIADAYGVCHTSVGLIKRRRRWAHI